MRLAYRTGMLCIACLTVGCQSPAPVQDRTVLPPMDPQAAVLLESGSYSGAMQRFEQMARAASVPDHYWLEAADAALRAGNQAHAQELAGRVNPQRLAPGDLDRFRLLGARVALNQGQASVALSDLALLSGHALAPADRKNYHILRASALDQSGEPVASAAERVMLDSLLTQANDIGHNHQVILETLARAPAVALRSAACRPPDALCGWIGLTLALRDTPQGDQPAALARWRADYPSHPAGLSGLAEPARERSSTLEPTHAAN